MPFQQKYQPLYEQFHLFIDRCLIDDRSFLWPDRTLWTAENVRTVHDLYVNSPVVEKGMRFEEQLQVQLQEMDQALWGIIADIYAAYYLPTSSVRVVKKQERVIWAASKAGFAVPNLPELWEAQAAGFVTTTVTTVTYNSKFKQFSLFLRMALQIKVQPDRQKFFQDHDLLQNLLDEILTNQMPSGEKAHDLRHAILYLTYPEYYERSISNRDKAKIVEYYAPQFGLTPSADVDADIFKIREQYTPEHNNEDGRPFDFYSDLEEEWKLRLNPAAHKPGSEKVAEPPAGDYPDHGSRTTTRILNILQSTNNLILYGPPGTGKTYQAKKAALARIQKQLGGGLSPTAALHRVIEGLTFYEILALSLYQAKPEQTFAVAEIAEKELMKARFTTNPVKSQKPVIWSSLQSHTDPEVTNVKVKLRVEPYLFWKSADSRWKLTNEGREYVENSLGDQIALLRGVAAGEARPEDYISFTTFHQSYAYEDFIEGLRPLANQEGASTIGYDILSGVFRRISDRATNDPTNDYVLIIDEINRGNIAKIMGELITLIEDDKRAGNPGAFPVTLPYSGESFIVPRNLFIIGTMNTADRSIALLDVALRRRFAFLEIMPDPELLTGREIRMQEGVLSLEKLLSKLNAMIVDHVDRDHQVGHSYFMKLSEADQKFQLDALEHVWNHQILPLLDEYFYSKRGELNELLANLYGLEDWSGGDLPRLEGEDIFAALIRFANSGDSDDSP